MNILLFLNGVILGLVFILAIVSHYTAREAAEMVYKLKEEGVKLNNANLTNYDYSAFSEF
jgi:hypothetical protein